MAVAQVIPAIRQQVTVNLKKPIVGQMAAAQVIPAIRRRGTATRMLDSTAENREIRVNRMKNATKRRVDAILEHSTADRGIPVALKFVIPIRENASNV